MKKTQVKLPGFDDYFVQEAFNVLRANIQFCGQDVKLIAVTSCGMNEGKTVLSLQMGKSLAELGKRVLIIDADMRKSVMAARNTDATNVHGLSEVLSGQALLKDSIYGTQTDNLHILFAGQYPPDPVKLLNGKDFDMVIEAVSNVYDYIIIDSPPLGMVIDAAVIAAKCDSAIMVIGNKHVKYTQAQNVVSQLKKSGCNVLGVILNNASSKNGAYYSSNAKQYGYYK